MIRNFKAVSKVMFSQGAVDEFPALLNQQRAGAGFAVFVVDHFFSDGQLAGRLGLQQDDLIFYLDTTAEPSTGTVDDYVTRIKGGRSQLPAAVIGVGGGAAMDVAKAVAIMLTNPGKTEEYQGWDLVRNPPVYKIGVPTISGTGSEVSRTTVLIGPVKKQGINSDCSLFDQIMLDPDLLATVPARQRFFTGMDCYIHSVEAVSGTFLNEFSKAYADKALELSTKVFLQEGGDADMMVASMLGGYSIVYSEVGICHALSYGISYAFGLHHGEANCVVFNTLDEYYPEHVTLFREMLSKNGVELPRNLVGQVSDAVMEKMIDMALLMEKPLCNAAGENWREIFTREKLKELYLKI